ncbi:DUF1203 domain-containing protein [Sphingomonas sp. MMS12-HWE2-04]|uniref:DUF1203 domain-containing protein n=1 Tax=Sphingomonas sp. MMS12-HWE2-04 TaxID=3234199 RepID=UPI00384EF51F
MASRVRHAVFAKQGAEAPARIVDEIPEQLATRLPSFRAFDHDGMMTNADVFGGNGLKPMIFCDVRRRAGRLSPPRQRQLWPLRRADRPALRYSAAALAVPPGAAVQR